VGVSDDECEVVEMSKIEWTDKTWNILTGCTKISAGCRNCYAADMANRFWGDRKFSDIEFHPERLELPLRWRKPRMVFVNSMSDLFHESVTDEQLDQVFAVMALTEKHTFQVLTKRPERMVAYFQKTFGTITHDMGRESVITRADIVESVMMRHADCSSEALRQWPLPNVWLGVTCESQKAADERIPLLLKTPAAVRFVSFEPLLERIALHSLHQFQNISWGICGGESGPKARKCAIEWIEDLVERHSDYGVACFVKQLGSKPTLAGEPYPAHGKGGDMSQWPESIQCRVFPEVREVTA
jgi:protein gp37